MPSSYGPQPIAKKTVGEPWHFLSELAEHLVTLEIPRGRFSRLQARDNDCTMQCTYSDACCVQNRVSCGRSFMICGRIFITV